MKNKSSKNETFEYLLDFGVSETTLSAFGIFEFVDFNPFNNLVFRDNHLGNSVPFIDYKILITHVNENNTYFSSVIRIAYLLTHRLFIL